MKKLSPVDHIALQTRDIKSTVNWYSNNFECDIVFEDDTWALLKFQNIIVRRILI